MPPATPRPKREGQSLVEFALVAPLILLLVFGIIDIARIIQAQVSVNNAARQAVRFAITG
jgi:Flp pilus assembly protein TadG